MREVNRTVVSQVDMENTQTDNISDIFTVQVVPPRHITLPPISSAKPSKEGSTVYLLIFYSGLRNNTKCASYYIAIGLVCLFCFS